MSNSDESKVLWSVVLKKNVGDKAERRRLLYGETPEARNQRQAGGPEYSDDGILVLVELNDEQNAFVNRMRSSGKGFETLQQIIELDFIEESVKSVSL